MNVIFMGTPQFAVPTMEILYKNGYNIELVVTQPDKPSGRGKKLKKSEVKEKAEELGLPILQPDRIKKDEYVKILRSYNPDFIVVVAFGQILSKEILDIPKYGCINVHASLLPALRGAAPLNWAIINGDKKTGITTMKMDAGLDTGDMLLKSEVVIDDEMNVGQLHDKLMEIGANLLIETLKGIENDSITPQKQDDNLSGYAPMIDKEISKIDWNNKAENIHNLIRGLSPWPTAYFSMNGKNIKVYKSEYAINKTEFKPGYVYKAEPEGIYIAVQDGTVIIKEFQMPGKKSMTVEAYLRGNTFPVGKIIE